MVKVLRTTRLSFLRLYSDTLTNTNVTISPSLAEGRLVFDGGNSSFLRVKYYAFKKLLLLDS